MESIQELIPSVDSDSDSDTQRIDTGINSLSIVDQPGIYQYSNVQKLSDAAVQHYHTKYDVYSLETMLLKIEIWHQLKKYYQNDISKNSFRE